jgi:hypothetical protein|tara:strand:+ start:137 stop:400 length:264 start_codon:yes stop_codon:yes gene_type:complete
MNVSHLNVLLVLAVWLFVGWKHAAHLLLAARHLIALSTLTASRLAILVEGHGHGGSLSACGWACDASNNANRVMIVRHFKNLLLLRS